MTDEGDERDGKMGEIQHTDGITRRYTPLGAGIKCYIILLRMENNFI